MQLWFRELHVGAEIVNFVAEAAEDFIHVCGWILGFCCLVVVLGGVWLDPSM